MIARRIGDAVILVPRNKAWATLLGSLGQFTDDFIAERDQPARPEKRRRL